MRLILISDTHETQEQIILPEGDVLIHAGDLTNKGSITALYQIAAWFQKQPFENKLVIAGNHDFCFQNAHKYNAVATMKEFGITYLQDEEITIDGIKFYGSPWQPWFYNWAFNLQRGEEIARKWKQIPDDANVLITHGPPFMIRDEIDGELGPNPSKNVGCEDLLNRIKQLKELKLHVFGHIHPGYGVSEIDGVKFVNAATCTEKYVPNNKPIIIDI